MNAKQVQQAHMQLARHDRQWPSLELPTQRGDVTVAEVIAASPGQERDESLRKWCELVWRAYGSSREQINALVKTNLGY